MFQKLALDNMNVFTMISLFDLWILIRYLSLKKIEVYKVFNEKFDLA